MVMASGEELPIILIKIWHDACEVSYDWSRKNSILYAIVINHERKYDHPRAWINP